MNDDKIKVEESTGKKIKIKIIQLLLKIYKGEIPEKIKYKDKMYHWEDARYVLDTDNDTELLCTSNIFFFGVLDDEVEIIEKKSPIDKLSFSYDEMIFETEYHSANVIEKKLITRIDKIIEKQLEIMDRVNNLLEESRSKYE